MIRRLALATFVAAIDVLLALLPAGAQEHAPRHLIYLHGRIVQVQQDPRPRSPEFGFYELEAILDAFRSRGFDVIGEIRPKAASVSDAADHVVAQVRDLVRKGTPSERITVVGASMGASIALLASARLQDSNARFAILGACLSANVRELVTEEGKAPHGRFLAVRESSDTLTGPCPEWNSSAERVSVTSLRAREIVLHTGLSHGFIYQPLPAWLDPVVAFASGRNGSDRPH